MAGELEYAMRSIDLYGWGASIWSVFHSPIWLGSENMFPWHSKVADLEYGMSPIVCMAGN
jgi:hypothetical protein